MFLFSKKSPSIKISIHSESYICSYFSKKSRSVKISIHSQNLSVGAKHTFKSGSVIRGKLSNGGILTSTLTHNLNPYVIIFIILL